mgnify:CR=1 FL=1
MLTLSRKRGERIFIGEDKKICIEILDVQGGKVRVGITCPKDIAIYREEVWNEMFGGKNESRKEN